MFRIAHSTFQELIRQRLILVIFFVAILMFCLSFLLGSISLAEEERILFHFGFSSVQLCLVGISLLIGSTLIPKEIDRQTCLIVLSRPIDRFDFYMGKLIGVAAVNFCIIGILTLMLWVLIGLQDSFFNFMKVGLGIYLESWILLTVTFFGTQFLRPIISLFLGIGIFLLGHWLNDLVFFAEKSKGQLYITAAKAIRTVMPQLFRLDWKSYYLVENNLISNSEFFSVSIHALGWTMLLIALGSWTFRRKDLV